MGTDMQVAVRLREVERADIRAFFAHHLEDAATTPPGRDRAVVWRAFRQRWLKHLADPHMLIRAIVVDNALAGYVAHFPQAGTPSISYRLGRAHWGKGIATRAVSLLLDLVQIRPIFARTSSDNAASLRVLGKCGFRAVGRDRHFSVAIGIEVEEIVLVRD